MVHIFYTVIEFIMRVYISYALRTPNQVLWLIWLKFFSENFMLQKYARYKILIVESISQCMDQWGGGFGGLV